MSLEMMYHIFLASEGDASFDVRATSTTMCQLIDRYADQCGRADEYASLSQHQTVKGAWMISKGAQHGLQA
eukprot:5134540-Ditylum_brightwellii.AAC.1